MSAISRQHWPYLGLAGVLIVILWSLQHGRPRRSDPQPGRSPATSVTHVAGRIDGIVAEEDGDLVVRLHANNHRIITILITPETGIAARRLRTGASMEVTGLRVRRDEGILYLPRNEHDIVLQPDLSGEGTLVTAVAEIARHRDGTALLLRVTGDRAEVFRSKAGRQHLRFQVHDASGRIEGVMWEGTFTPDDRQLLASRRPLRLEADVRRHRGRASLVGVAVTAE